MADLTISADAQKPITVDLVGVEYELRPPKASLGVAIALRARAAEGEPEEQLAVFNRWLAAAFGKKSAAAIEKRLADPDDLLDLPHISQLMEKVTEVASGNPTT